MKTLGYYLSEYKTPLELKMFMESLRRLYSGSDFKVNKKNGIVLKLSRLGK